MSLDTRADISLGASLASGLDLNATALVQLKLTKSLQLSSGTGLGQADQMWFDTRTIAASGTDDLDLAGVLVNGLGQTVTFARIKGLYVAAAAANTNNVVVGGAAANQFTNWVADVTDKIVVRPGGVFLLFTGGDATSYAVTAATGDILRIANSGAGTSVDYDIVLIGSTV